MARQSERQERGSQQEQSEFLEKLVGINRVAKVVKGGRRFGFAALVVVGDGSGNAGFGTGKAKEVPEAIRKATEGAKRDMDDNKKVPLRQGRTLHHDIRGRHGAGRVLIRAAQAGTGIIAGGPMRAVFEVLGVQDVVAKSIGSSNPHNMIKATFSALRSMQAPASVAGKRGKSVEEIFGRPPRAKKAAAKKAPAQKAGGQKQGGKPEGKSGGKPGEKSAKSGKQDNRGKAEARDKQDKQAPKGDAKAQQKSANPADKSAQKQAPKSDAKSAKSGGKSGDKS